jgi:hypothetical protein
MSKRRATRMLVWEPSPDDNEPSPMSLSGRLETGCLLRRLQLKALYAPHRTRERTDIGRNSYQSYVRDGKTEWCLAYRLTDRHVVIAGLFLLGSDGHLGNPDRIGLAFWMLPSKPLEDGWHAGDVDEFLELTEAQVRLVDIRVALADKIWLVRSGDLGLTQAEVARIIGSSQSRVAAMEVPTADVSLDLLVRTLVSLGVGRIELARVIAGRR